MSRLTLNTFSQLVCLSLVACSSSVGPGGEGPLMGLVPDSPDLPGELPLRGKGTAGITGFQPAPGYPGGRSTFGGRCSVPSDYVIRFEGAGHFTHLGAVDLLFEHCSQVDFSTGNVTYGDGVLAYTAANGDELRGTYGNGTGAPISETETGWQDSFLITGGTGRFAGASGGGVDEGWTHNESGFTEYEAEGVIVYRASSRSR